MRITGAAKVAGVVGWPVAHSLSPLIHNAWIEALGLDAAYVPFAVPPERFESFVEACRFVLVGLNVTLPHKQRALELAAGWTAAVYAQAANLLTFDEGEVSADNTDAEGLLAAFAEQAAEWRADVGPVVVIGAGGAARAAVGALSDAGAPEVRVVARRKEAATELAEMNWCDMPVRSYGFDNLSSALSGATAVINATSAGLNGAGELPDMAAAPPETVFMDMIYSPLRTAFLEAARVRGHSTVDGLAMLIGQARPSFLAFFGVEPPSAEVVDVRALCLRALGERG